MQKDVSDFLDVLLKQISGVGINVRDLRIDHIAYSCGSPEEYEKLLPIFVKDGVLVKEAIISDRRVAIIQLNSPMKYHDYSIGVTELIEPINGQETMSGWEHAEFLVDDYDSFLKLYPDLNWNVNHKDRENFSRIKLILPNGMEVKFLNTPVLVSAALEK